MVKISYHDETKYITIILICSLSNWNTIGRNRSRRNWRWRWSRRWDTLIRIRIWGVHAISIHDIRITLTPMNFRCWFTTRTRRIVNSVRWWFDVWWVFLKCRAEKISDQQDSEVIIHNYRILPLPFGTHRNSEVASLEEVEHEIVFYSPSLPSHFRYSLGTKIPSRLRNIIYWTHKTINETVHLYTYLIVVLGYSPKHVFPFSVVICFFALCFVNTDRRSSCLTAKKVILVFEKT